MRVFTPLAACAVALSAHFSAHCAETASTSQRAKKGPDAEFEARKHTDADGRTLRYRLLLPEGYASSTEPHPLLVFLHGAGQRGSDNHAQLAFGKNLMQSAAKQYGCLVLVPQCKRVCIWAGRHWRHPKLPLSEQPSEPLELVFQVIEQLKTEYRIDSNRLYVMGLSMGGFGAWDAIQRYPNMFAAAVPICGGGDETRTETIAKVPVWIIHGQNDPIVPVARSRQMFEALRAAGGNPRYSELPGIGHPSWVPAFDNPELLPWLTSQRRQEDSQG